MGALRAKRRAWRLECNDRAGQRRSWGFKGNVMRDRAGGRRAAKGAGLKVGVRSAVVVRPGVVKRMRCRHSRQSDGTQFQGERYAAGRHEAGGNIGAKQKQDQQPEAGPVSSPANDGRPAHQGPRIRRSRGFFSADRGIPWSIGASQYRTPGRTRYPIGPIRRKPPAIPPARQSFEFPWNCPLG